MTTTTNNFGRLGNQIIRNLAVSLIAEKNDLYVNYSSNELINKLGINLFIGNKKYDNTIILSDVNYFEIFNKSSIENNLNPNNDFFQTKDIINLLYNNLNKDNVKKTIMDNNPFKYRYNNNNDLFIHIRLTDAINYNPGIEYYLKAISNILFEKLYIATDDKTHEIIKNIIEKYPNIILLDYDEIMTIQFGSTCKNIILSHGSFSAVIGYLSFFSNINYPDYKLAKIIWFGDMFSINGWNKIDV